MMSLQAQKPLQLELPRSAHAPALARAALAQIDVQTEDVGDRLALLTTELVSNAVRHGRGAIRLTATFDVALIRVAVEDDGGGFLVEAALAVEGGAAGGFGLKIVDRLADRWGADGTRGHVWFELVVA
jgi:two-component sensor histidine kinase